MARWVLVLVLLAGTASADKVWDVRCGDGSRYVGTNTPPRECGQVCDDGRFVRPSLGEACAVEEQAEQPSKTTHAIKDAVALVVKAIMGLVAASAVIFCVFCVYFFPWLVARERKHHQRKAIGVLNLFFGWTFVGWVIALVWATTAVDTRDRH